MVTAQQTQPKLAVILHADIAGSTALVQRDETIAHQRITNAFSRFSETIERYGGRVHEIRGDALLAEFARASDAVCAALAFQRSHTAHRAELNDEMVPAIRIGISLGEVVFADGTATGAGVVLAQRVEQLAKPDGLCITGAIHEAMPQRLPVEQENLGERMVKGFEEPVHVYAVRISDGAKLPEPTAISTRRRALTTPWIAGLLAVVFFVGGGLLAWLQPWAPELDPVSGQGMSHPLTGKPSIAVLPFDNLSGDPQNQFLADGLTEDIITILSRVPDLFVIARNSTFTYKGKPVKVQQVAAELGVRYVLEGSLQRSGDRLRVTAQFIDATTGHHLWADRFDHEVGDIFALQDEIAHKILIELQVKLTSGEHGRVASRGTTNLEVWLLRLQAVAEGSKYNKEGMLKARDHCAAAVKIDPKFARMWACLAWTYWFEARLGGWTHTREEALQKGIEFAEHAIEIDPQEPLGYMQLANLVVLTGDYDRSIDLAEQATALTHNDYQSTGMLAVQLVWAGEPERAIGLFQHARRLSPKYPAWIDWMMGLAQLMVGEYEDAVTTLERGVNRAPKAFLGRGRLAAGYAATNRLDEAKAEVVALLEIKPDLTVSKFVKIHPFKDPAHKESLRELLFKAGLPGGKPS